MTTLPRIMLEHAAAHPDRTAVADSRDTLTYAELVARAERWRAALPPWVLDAAEPIVGVLRPRGVDTPAAQLGVWFAGGAYLPLAPGLPAGRIADVLATADCRAVITTPELAGSLPDGVLAITEPAATPAGTPPAPCGADRLAYVIYTSGSTGHPKGVAIEHGNLTALLDWYCPFAGLAEDCRVAMCNGLGFDATVADTWAPLAVGGQLHVPAESTVRDVTAVIAFLAEREVTQCLLATPLAELLIGSGECPPSLRSLAAGGDVLRVWPPEDFPAAVHNLYGPTEGTVAATTTDDLRSHPGRDSGGLPPIGRPRGRCRVELRDATGQVVTAPGVPGELYLGGPALARGYHRAPELTESVFTEEPAGARWYRAGDVCAWTANGELEFRGRKDRQVKLRGFRIELGEIEQVLLRAPGVTEAAVLLLDQALVAWFAGTPDESEVREHAAERLPDYMVPTRFVALPSLPLSTNGKIDRTALAGMTEQPAELPEQPAEPLDELTALVSRSWQQVLGLAPTADTDFFAVGGHSLRANQVTVRLRQRLGVPLTLDVLFDHPRFDAYVDAVRQWCAAGAAEVAGPESGAGATGRPLIVVYDVGSATPHAIALAARDLCPVVFFADLAGRAGPALARAPEGTSVVDLGGLSERDVCRRAAALRPSGVVTFSDTTIPLAAAIAKRCGLPFHSQNTAAALQDKFRQREALRAHGVQTTGCVVVRSAGDLPGAIDRVGLPAVLKPRAGAGSVNTCLVRSLADAVDRITEFAEDGPADYVLEEYIVGDPTVLGERWGDYLSVESSVRDGHVTCVGITGKLPLAPPFRESGMFLPAMLDPDLTERVLTLERAALAALGIRHGVTHTELTLTRDGPRVIEVNGRMGGFVNDLLLRSRGVDILRLTLRLAVGEVTEGQASRQHGVAFRYFITAPRDDVAPGPRHILDDLVSVPGVDMVDVTIPAGWAPNWRSGTNWIIGTVFGIVADHAELATTLAELDDRMAPFWQPAAMAPAGVAGQADWSTR